MNAVAPFCTSQRRIIEHRSWMMVNAAILRAIDRPGTVVLTGLPGTGKSLLLAELAQMVMKAGRRVALLRHAGDEHDDSGDLLLIDEADKLDPAALARLQSEHPCCVFAGLPGLLDRLPRMPTRPTTLVLTPLHPEEAGTFIRGQLALGEGPEMSMDDEAASLIVRYAAGVPRNLQVVTGAAAFVADLEGSSTVLPAHVRAAIEMRFGADGEQDPGTTISTADGPVTGLAIETPEPDRPEQEVDTPASVSTLRPVIVSQAPARAPARSRLVVMAYVGGMAVMATGIMFAGPSSRPTPVAPTASAPANPVVAASAPAPAPAVAVATVSPTPTSPTPVSLNDIPPAPASIIGATAEATMAQSQPRPDEVALRLIMPLPALDRTVSNGVAGSGSAAAVDLQAVPAPDVAAANDAGTGLGRADPPPYTGGLALADATTSAGRPSPSSRRLGGSLEALPALAAPRILITYPERDAPNAQAAQALVARFTREGAIVSALQTRPLNRARGILFFFAEDAPAARIIAQRLGAQARPAGRSADMPPGTIELALPLTP